MTMKSVFLQTHQSETETCAGGMW